MILHRRQIPVFFGDQFVGVFEDTGAGYLSGVIQIETAGLDLQKDSRIALTVQVVTPEKVDA